MLILGSAAYVFPQEIRTSAGGNLGLGTGTLAVQVTESNRPTLDFHALVRLRGQSRGQEEWLTTQVLGVAEFSNLLPDTYQVEVSAAGYQTATVRIGVQAGAQTTEVRIIKDPDSEIESYTINGASRKARAEAEKGIVSWQLGHSGDSEKHFRKALQDAPQNPQVNYLLGMVLVRGKNPEQAEPYLQKAVDTDKRNVRALIALGGLRIDQKNYPAAAKLLEDAIAVNPRQWRAHWMLANARLSQNDSAAALQEAQTAVELSGGAPYARLVYGEALAKAGRPAEGIAILRNFLQENPKSPDAAAVRQMVSRLESSGGAPEQLRAEIKPTALSIRTSPLLAFNSPGWQPIGVDDLIPPVASGVACPLDRVLKGAADRENELVANLDKFSATQVQTHERLDLFGKSLYSQMRKRYYMASIVPASRGVQVEEFTRDLDGLGAFPDKVVTHGMLSLSLIFHPALRDTYQMECEGLGEWKGEPAWLIHFRQKDNAESLTQGFRIGHDNHLLALKGRAWLLATSFHVAHIEAELTQPMPDIQLLSEHQVADYGPVQFKTKSTELWLPKETQTYLDFHGAHLRVSDRFDDFVLFSVDSTQQTKTPQ